MKAWKVVKAPCSQITDRLRATRKWPKFILWNFAMDLDVKLLQTPEGRNHLIIITRGQIDAEGLELILRQVAETIQELFNCKVLIDFENANLRLEPSDIDVLVNRLGPDLRLGNIKIALVSSPEIDELEQLKVLGDSLCREDLRAAVFDYAEEAVTWLVDTEVC
jgi:hypothetical protein